VRVLELRESGDDWRNAFWNAFLGCIFLGWPDMHFSPGKMHVFCMLASPGKYIPKMHSFFGWEMRKSNTQNQVTAKIADGPQVLVWAGGSCYPRALGSHIINHIQALFLAYLIPWVSVLMAPFGAYKMVCTWYRHCLRFTSWYVFGIGMRSMI